MFPAFFVAGLVALLASQAGAPAAPSVDPKVVVDRMVQVMGGQANWDRVRYLRFDWVVERDGNEVTHVRHLFDRASGRYRVEWQAKDKKAVQVLFDVGTRAGHVWLNGAPAAPDEEKTYLEQACKHYVNDSYWLLMPWKLEDPGVHVEWVGEAPLKGEEEPYDLLHVTFDKAGMAPGDHYWAYISRATHFMERWAYFPPGTESSASLEKATPWAWQDWQKVGGGVLLARERQQMSDTSAGFRIHFPVLAVLENVDPSVFTSPAVPMPGEPQP